MNSALVSMIAFVAGVKNRLTGEERAQRPLNTA